MATACPYHAQVLAIGKDIYTRDLNPMRRFLAEGPGEQSALFTRSDTGELSTAKGCTCSIGQSTCGVFQGTSLGSCPHCRDVPESDIDSPRTSWECNCGGGCLAAHDKLCERRQRKKTIVRVIYLQQVLVEVFNAETMTFVVCGFKDRDTKDGLSERVIYYKRCSLPVSKEPVFVIGLPRQVIVQACCVDNCVAAITTTSPTLAWWTEGMAIKFQEFGVVPQPAKRIVFQQEGATDYKPPATNADSSWEEDPQLGAIQHQEGRVADATFPQYDYDRNCHSTLEYIRDKVEESEDNTVYPFGRCYEKHSHAMYEQLAAYNREIGIRAMNDAVHREIFRLGGRRKFLVLCSHMDFLDSCKQLVTGVRTSLQELRAKMDALWFPSGPELSEEQQWAELQALLGDYTTEWHCKVMQAFNRKRANES